MNNILNLELIRNPLNWVMVFVIFSIWAFAAHFGAKSLGVS